MAACVGSPQLGVLLFCQLLDITGLVGEEVVVVDVILPLKEGIQVT